MKQLSRDPFARITYLRETVHLYNYDHTTCAWCGSRGRTTKTGRTLYRYGYENDGLYSRPIMEKELFCSQGCHKSYHL